MPWHPECPRNELPYGGQQTWITPRAICAHRTVGHWGGDYAVLSRSFVPSVHFLIGEGQGEWVQFYDSARYLAHAAGANQYSIGIEFSGVNDSGTTFPPLNAWQLEAGGKIVRWLMDEHGIPDNFLNRHGGRVANYNGTLNHSNVAGSDHWDYIDEADYRRMLGGEEDDMFSYLDRAVMVRTYEKTSKVLSEQRKDSEADKRRDRRIAQLLESGEDVSEEEAAELAKVDD